ncbi:MAG: translational GTPase TypA [Rhodospirillaceae bacterium]|nr:translational GTPase TypA [Rhodospirillaceae bacterium]|tara:strand:- start:2160 stop:3989 length:1830 start_codon:yes stop_codon:yes gene_type:complete
MELRNIAIIAHVDHGKTTLVDSMLYESGTLRKNERISERALDSGDIEKERGITILSKCTSIISGNTRINIVDTPGHADFGGEVERILDMVDGVIILVDAAEGPMPQTKFVLDKALRLGLRPIVVLNKIDRSDSRSSEVLDEVFDLFDSLGADDEQLDFPVLFASGRDGWATKDIDKPNHDLKPLFQLIIKHVPRPQGNSIHPFELLVSIQEVDPYLGRILTGRIYNGSVMEGDNITALNRDGKIIENGRINKLFSYSGLKRIPIPKASAGDIIAIAGFTKASVSHTLAAPDSIKPLKSQPIDPPTMSVIVSINDSPISGIEGTYVTSRVIGDRLIRESEHNVAISVTDSEKPGSYNVSGRGELQLGVLFETMRREGYEFSVSRPEIIERVNSLNGKREEPVEEILIDLDNDFVGIVVEGLSKRKSQLINMTPSGNEKTRLIFRAPSRGLIGYHGEFMTATRGTGVIHRIFCGYEPYFGEIHMRLSGVLVSISNGSAIPFALSNLEERGILFISPGDKVYNGMILGEHSRRNDLEVNPMRTKQLTNIRAAGKDEAIKLSPPKKFSLESAIAYIADDELVEVTPRSIRLRKHLLDPNDRKRALREKKTKPT